LSQRGSWWLFAALSRNAGWKKWVNSGKPKLQKALLENGNPEPILSLMNIYRKAGAETR
jgi:hypothetical protein